MINFVFMIDDDQDDREVFQEAITHCCPDVQVEFAIDGTQAVKTLSSTARKPDIIFLDHNMPGLNGVDCLRVLKGQENTKSIPVVMYTTSGDREEEKVAALFAH